MAESVAAAAANPRTALLIAILIAALHAFMAVTAANTESPTFDEPQHLTAGYSYWVRNDFRLDPENGNLAARWAALPLVFGDTRFVRPDDPSWQSADEGGTAHKFFYELGNDPDRMMAQARLMMSIFGLGLCLLVYRIGREFFGVLGGLVAETLIAFDPNFLAHSALVTSDVPAAFFFTAAIWSCWRLFQQLSLGRFAIAALSLSAVFLTKFSAPIVLPALLAVSVLQIAAKSAIAIRFGQFRTTLTETGQKCWAVGCTWLLLTITVIFAIWSSFSFRYAAWNENAAKHEEQGWHWNYVLEQRGGLENASRLRAFIICCRKLTCMASVTFINTRSIGLRFSTTNGALSALVHFFRWTFLYKTPLPFLCLIALALCVAIARRQNWKLEKLLNPFAIFVAIYAAFAIGTQLNIGHRHILPIYPALFVACGIVVHLLQKKSRALFASAIAVLLSWQIGESLVSRPNYLAYFNQIAGGPRKRVINTWSIALWIGARICPL